MPRNTVTAVSTRVRVEIELAVADGSPVLDAFGTSSPVTGIRLTFHNNELRAVLLETADPVHCAFVDTPDLERPQAWPEFLRDAVAANDPARHEQEATSLRSTVQALREVLNDTALPESVHEQLLRLLDG